MNPVSNHEKIKELYEQGLSDYGISKQANCSAASVWRWRTKRNLPSHTSNKPAAAKQQETSGTATVRHNEDKNMIDSACRRINIILGTMDKNDIPAVTKTYYDLAEEIFKESLNKYFKTNNIQMPGQKSTAGKATNNAGGSGNTYNT